MILKISVIFSLLILSVMDGASVRQLIAEASKLDLDTIDEDIRRRFVIIDKEFAQLAVLKTMSEAVLDPNAVVLHVRLTAPGDGIAKLSDGSYINLQPWYQSVFDKGGRVFSVLDVLSGEVPELKHIIVMLREGRGEVDLSFQMLKFHSTEMIIALIPYEGDVSVGDEAIFYQLYGQTLFTHAITSWPYPKSPSYFDGVFSKEESEELLNLLTSGYFDSVVGSSKLTHDFPVNDIGK